MVTCSYKPTAVSKKRINYLLEKYIRGTIDEAERLELQDLYNSISSKPAEYSDAKAAVNERMLLRLENELHPNKNKQRFTMMRRLAAATIAILISVSLYLFTRSVEKNNTVVKSHVAKEVITPGSNVAVLTLGNGKKVVLNNSINGKLTTQGNTTITKTSAGHITYLVTGRDDSRNMPVSFNVITTPAGGQYTVTLPDGSNVWLNAASSLRYPSRFSGAERHVQLHGEAYFEIHKNKNVPFTVTAEGVNVKVLGTHFNIMAYNNEPSVNTTLLEGSVALSSKGEQKIIIPGQQAVVNKAGDHIAVQPVNVADAVAWKNGYFSFRKSNIRTAMNKIARWYNAEVEYRGNVNNKILGGTVSRAENIEKLLSYLELTGIAKFKIEGRRVIVICK